MSKNEISDEKYERIRSHIEEFSYVDLVMWRNDLINSGSINNRLYQLIDFEIKRRRIDINKNESERSK